MHNPWNQTEFLIFPVALNLFFFRLDSLQLRVSETLLNVCKSIFYDIAVSALTYSGTVYPQMNGKKLYLLDVLIAYALSYFLL